MVNFRKSYLVLILAFITLFAGNLFADNDEKIKLVREIEELKYELDNTKWTIHNRAKKIELRDKIAHIESTLQSVDNYQLSNNFSEITDEEVRLIREIEDLKYELKNKDWTWFNKEEKHELKERLEHLENILDKVKDTRLNNNRK